MKPRLFLLYLIFFHAATLLFSQITLNSNNFPVGGLQAGRGYVLSYANALGNPGANQFYDFTNITPVLHDSIKYYIAAQTLWTSYHPGATVAGMEASNNIKYVYYYTPGPGAFCRTGLTLIGDFGQGIDTVHGNYSSPDTLLTNQYTYGYSKTVYSSVTIPNILTLVNYQIKTRRNILVDGWGQLETPLNYYSDVLRVKYAEYRYDTAFIITTPSYYVADTQYYYDYYAKDVRQPVVRAHTDKNYNLQYFEYLYTPPVITGCMDSMALNYNPLANQADGNCIYCSVNYSITPDTTICQGTAITLNISGGSSYLWSDGSTGSSLAVTPTETTVYTAYVSNSPVCHALASVEVTVDKPVTAMFWTTLDHYNTGDLIQFINLSSNASIYQWSFDDVPDGFSSLPYPSHTYAVPGMKHIILIASNTCYSDTITDSIMIHDGTFIGSQAFSDVYAIYPNPGADHLFIEGHFDKSASLEINTIDMLGRKRNVAFYKNISGDFRLQNDFSQLEQGVYMIELIKNGEQITLHKWIKTK
ncbi:MAG TPA: T9SS type A sorting domain-containing protein [Bacteroidales bacterium]|nr:T9SS type A sorting domain-containing protein [Bacteroidales bacterium]